MYCMLVWLSSLYRAVEFFKFIMSGRYLITQCNVRGSTYEHIFAQLVGTHCNTLMCKSGLSDS